MELDAVIKHIQVRAGFSAYFRWDTYQQYGWNWGWDICRRDVEGEQVQRKQQSKEKEEEEVIFLREQCVPPKTGHNELQDTAEGINGEQVQRKEEEVIFLGEQRILPKKEENSKNRRQELKRK